MKKERTLVDRLAEALYLEHEMKCDLLEVAPPGKGNHCVSTCKICELGQEAYRKTPRYKIKKKEIMRVFK